MNIRTFCWRRRVPLTVAYVVLLAGVVGATCWYAWALPAGLDEGATVAARSVFYRSTFAPVRLARADIDAGKLERAELRLEQFIERHPDIQPSQLETHAISDAHELLADVYAAQGRPRKAVKVLGEMADRTPLNYRLWYLKAKAGKAAGDYAGAAKDLRAAFKLALDHPDVARDYLAVLQELGDYEQILWAADHFQRATRRSAPSVLIKVGVARRKVERRLLTAAGLEVGHGKYALKFRRFDLPRGSRQIIPVDADVLDASPLPKGRLYVQLDFAGIYDGLTIDGFHYWTRHGERRTYRLTGDRVGILHRSHSAVELIAEIQTDLAASDVARFEVAYSCPQPRLSADALAIVDKARANLQAKGVKL